jgi:Protein of unknown function (DUF2723)
LVLGSWFLVLLTVLLFLAFLALYIRTAAPSVLAGDSAEFQFAAPLLGVPHPTTYPLYVLLGKLATLLTPFGDLAWRVTLVSAGSAALAVALFFLLARRVTRSAGAAAVAALALGLAPGLWNAATLAEVYALLAALLVALAYLLMTTDDHTSTVDRAPIENRPNLKSKIQNLKSVEWRLRLAAFVAGLGCTYHGLFVLAGLPLFVGYVLWLLLRRPTPGTHRPSPIARDGDTETTSNRQRTTDDGQRPTHILHFTFYALPFKQLAILTLCFAAGLAPWLYPLVQFARYGPFDGQDYGLPRHYFWGAPRSWGAVLDLMTGGAVRRGIFRAPTPDAALATLRLVGSRIWFEFGPLGVPLGLLGCAALVRRSRCAWFGAAWVFLVTLVYLLLLGPGVGDEPIFTLPMLLPWALWIAAGVELILAGIRRTKEKEPRTKNREPGAEGDHLLTLSSCHLVSLSGLGNRWSAIALALLVVATLAWGDTRLLYSSKRRLWLFREFGQATLARLPMGAVVITHWEQGTTLQYLRLAEGQRPDVWVDMVEPADEAWGSRARRYVGRPVFFVGRPADVADLPVELVREVEYADLFELRGE